MYPYKSVSPGDVQHVLRDIEENGYTNLLGFEWAEWKERGIETLIVSLKEIARWISNSIQSDVDEAKTKGFEVRPIIIVFGNDGDLTAEQEEEVFNAGGIFHDRAGDTREGGEILAELIKSATQAHLNDSCCDENCGCGSKKCSS
jgi:hypothetical protein